MSYGTTKKGDDGVKLLRSKAEDVQGVMKENIKATIERGEKVDELELQSSNLLAGSKHFEKGATKMRDNLKWGYYKRWIILIIIISVILLVIVGIIVAVVVTQVKK
jgi:t-SNARE complex subunit (syntaxin)